MGVTTVFTEAEVESALGPADLSEVIDLIEQAYRDKADGSATLHPLGCSWRQQIVDDVRLPAGGRAAVAPWAYRRPGDAGKGTPLRLS